MTETMTVNFECSMTKFGALMVALGEHMGSLSNFRACPLAQQEDLTALKRPPEKREFHMRPPMRSVIEKVLADAPKEGLSMSDIVEPLIAEGFSPISGAPQLYQLTKKGIIERLESGNFVLSKS